MKAQLEGDPIDVVTQRFSDAVMERLVAANPNAAVSATLATGDVTVEVSIEGDDPEAAFAAGAALIRSIVADADAELRVESMGATREPVPA
jgi:hypothetical protein